MKKAKKAKKPLRLITAKQLRVQHGLSWHRVQRRVDRGQIVPFACTIGPSGSETNLWHPKQIEELKQTCANQLRKLDCVNDNAASEHTD